MENKALSWVMAARKCYADQNEQDYHEFVNAIRSGQLEATDNA